MKLIWEIFIFKESLKTTGVGGELAVQRGKIPFLRSEADCAPAGPGRGWTTPLWALSLDGMGKASRYYLLETGAFLLPSPFLRVFPYICSDQRCANIPKDKHGYSCSSGWGTPPRQARILSSPPPMPSSPPPLSFQIAHLFLERRFGNLIGVRVERARGMVFRSNPQRSNTHQMQPSNIPTSTFEWFLERVKKKKKWVWGLSACVLVCPWWGGVGWQ